MQRFSLCLLFAILLAGCNGETSKPVASDPALVSAPVGASEVISSEAPTPTTSVVASSPNDPAGSASQIRSEYEWVYETSKDELRDATTYYANLTSDPAPVSSNSSTPRTITLVLRMKANGDKDIFFFDPEAGFECLVYSGCQATYRFDDKPVKTVHLLRADSSQPNAVFVDQTKAFTRELRGSRTLLIEFKFLLAGTQQYRFHTEGLEWKHW